MELTDQTAANDNATGPTGIERCQRLIEMMAIHPSCSARYVIAASMFNELAHQNDQDGFHIAADFAEGVFEDEPWHEVQTVRDATGQVIGFDGWIDCPDGVIAAAEEAVLEPTPAARVSAMRALVACIVDDIPGEWGWGIACFLSNRRTGRMRPGKSLDLKTGDLKTEINRVKWQVHQVDGEMSDGS